MTVDDLFEEIRSKYITTLEQALTNPDAVHVEPAFRNKDGTVAVEGRLALPYRADCIYKSGPNAGKSGRVDSTSHLMFDHIQFDLNGASIVISSFSWDWLTIKVAGISNETCDAALKHWFLRWFDPDDQNKADSNGLFNVVHFMSDPVSTSDGYYAVNIDLGSSPVDALNDLLFVLSDARASDIILF